MCVKERGEAERVKGILVNYTPVSVMSGQKTIKLLSFFLYVWVLFFVYPLYAKMGVKRAKNSTNKKNIWQCGIMHEIKT